MIGPAFFDPDDVKRLIDRGLVTRKAATSYPQLAYLFGRVLADVGEDVAKGMTFKEFLSHVEQHGPRMTTAHKAAIKHAGRSLYTHIKGLGDKVDKATGEIILDGDRRLRNRLQREIRQRTTLAVERQQTADEVSRSIAAATGDYARDWHRIFVTEINNAVTEGRADEIVEKSERGNQARVFKRPRPDACAYCKALYLEADEATPQVFVLEDMRGFGSNVGLKKGEWRPVIGSCHPHCRCTLHELPRGFTFATDGRMTLETP